MGEERLCERFVRHCAIPSITGDERAMADAVAEELRSFGIEHHEDGSAGPARAGAGNVLARVPGASDRWVMFCAHLDTVPHDGVIEAVEVDGVFRSAGETILGADNKAAVTVVFELIAEAAEAAAEGNPPPIGIEVLFTVAEEQGLRGAHAFDPAGLKSTFGFVLDHATPIGEIITAAPTYKKLDATFTGVPAHAGLRPEDGHSAIEAASAAIKEMDLGRLDDETTANVGVIGGGTAPNVVAASCSIEAEARSIELGRVEEVLMSMVDACQWAAGEHHCDVDVEISELFRGYRVPAGAPSVAVARDALQRCGFAPSEVSTGGGSDANALRRAGFDALLLANGTVANHTHDEAVSREDLVRMLDVCRAAVDVAAEAGGPAPC